MAKPNEALEAGDRAPRFSMRDEAGDEISLSDFAGKALVLYFYPKDDTSGCTAEAIDFSGLAGKFKSAGAAVLGVSKDSPLSHGKFTKKHNLRVSLASDEDTKIAQAYGVWVEKSMYGRKYMGMERATFLIDRGGVIRRIWRKVKVTGHAAEVLEAVRAL